MKTSSRVGVLAAAVAVVVGGVLATQWFVQRRATVPKSQTAAIAAPEGALKDVRVRVLRSELGAEGTAAILKVTIHAANDGKTPVRLGPGSFWLLDEKDFPHLDRNAAKQPDAPPLTLEPGRESPEITMQFNLPATSLSGPLVLLAGPAPTGQVVGSKPSPESLRVPVKEKGAPRGPFTDGSWRTFTGTHWR